MGWIQVPVSEIMSDADYDSFGANMQLWRPTDIPAGEPYFKCTRLTLNFDGTMNVHTQVVTDAGAPISGIAFSQGWQDGDQEPSDSIPQGGDPRGYPNRGTVVFSNSLGVCEWTWGAGEGFDPDQSEGPHWFWVPMGPAKYWSDVVYGFGWRWGTNHDKIDSYWTRYISDEPEPPEPPTPPDDDFEAQVLYYLEKIATKLEQGWRTVPAYPGD